MNDLKLMSFEIQIRWTCNNVFKLFTRMSKKIILYIINYNYTVIEANVIIFICKKKRKKKYTPSLIKLMTLYKNSIFA